MRYQSRIRQSLGREFRQQSGVIPENGEAQAMQRARQLGASGIAFLWILSGFAFTARGASPADTCVYASLEVSSLPYSDTYGTTGESDDYNLANAGICAGGGTQSPGTGNGSDVAYLITVDKTCDLNVNLYPALSVNLALYVVTDCGNVATNCVGVDDGAGNGGHEQVTFTANSGTYYYILVDGSGGAAGSYQLTIGESTNTGCSLISLPAPAVEATKSDALQVDVGNDGKVNPGDTIRYKVEITNNSTLGTAAGVEFSDTPDSNTALVVGSVGTSVGTVTSGNNPGDTSVTVTGLGPMPAGRTETIVFDVMVNNPLVTQVVNQGTVSGANFSPVPSDDPDIAGQADATVTAVFPAQVGGTSCEAVAQCDSGFCSDGVCCDSACDAPGEVCDLPGHVGTCTIAVARSECGRPAPAVSRTGLLMSVGVLAAIGLVALYRRRFVAQ